MTKKNLFLWSTRCPTPVFLGRKHHFASFCVGTEEFTGLQQQQGCLCIQLGTSSF